MPVRVPFSTSTVFEICRHKMCRFRVNGRGGFSISSTSSRTLSKFHRFVSENKIIMIIMKMRFMMKRIINDFESVALPGYFI